jgi:hypothetical protein
MSVADWLPTLVTGVAGRPVAPGKDGIDVWEALLANATSPRREALLQLSGPVNGSWCANCRK